ncbi:MAG: hypothetical protein NTW74_25155 [Acidobacteria bacterium]|nr:hypothetical protein [Acidobacteriota bacterium]
MHSQIGLAGSASIREVKDAFAQNAIEKTVGFGAGSGEVVIDQSMALLAGSGQAVFFSDGSDHLVHPENRMNVLVGILRATAGSLSTKDFGSAKAGIALHQNHRAAERGSQMKRDDGFATGDQTGEMDGGIGLQVCQCSGGN